MSNLVADVNCGKGQDAGIGIRGRVRADGVDRDAAVMEQDGLRDSRAEDRRTEVQKNRL
jgi:hypothetical protein